MPRGTAISGWWAWWGNSGDTYARRFTTEEDAIEYIPTVKTKTGTPVPLGIKKVMRVVWDYENGWWSNDTPKIFTQEAVEQQWRESQEAA